MSGNLLQFFREELVNREKFDYPPYTNLIKVTMKGTKPAIMKSQTDLEDLLKEYNPLIYRAFIPRVKTLYILNALLKVKKENWSLPEITANGKLDQNLLNRLKSLPLSYTIQVDPDDLL